MTSQFVVEQVKMVTGDQLAIAVETCRRLGLGTNIIEGKNVTFESHRISAELAHQVCQGLPALACT